MSIIVSVNIFTVKFIKYILTLLILDSNFICESSHINALPEYKKRGLG
jgi:hypothetical protein